MTYKSVIAWDRYDIQGILDDNRGSRPVLITPLTETYTHPDGTIDYRLQFLVILEILDSV